MNLPKLKERATDTAAALEEQSSIPVVQAHMTLIQAVQTDPWWQDVTAGLLETMRKALRGLVHLIDRTRRRTIYTDFEDEFGEGAEVAFDTCTSPDAFEKFRVKARRFLQQHQARVAVHKLRTNRQLTPTDLEELERMLSDTGVGARGDVARATARAQGLGLFVRALVGLDRTAAKQAFAVLLAGWILTGNQIEFVDMVVEQLRENA